MILLLLNLLFLPVVQPVYQTYIQYQPIETTTPLKVLQRTHKVTQGFVCFYPLEVKCIDDLCAEEGKSFWIVKVNGDSDHYNANSKIKPGDSVEWVYVSSEGK